MFRPLIVLTLLSGAWISQAHAEETDMARWYRFYNEKNQPTVTDRITEEHTSRGYEALDKNMQLLRKVPPQRKLTQAEVDAAKAKRTADAKRVEDDKQLLRLYSKPADAENNRNRQIDAIQLRIDFTTSSYNRLRDSRAREAQKAAVLERTGKPVPKPLRDNIANFDKQILQMQTEIQARKTEQEKIRSDFAPIIQRLSELTGLPATPAAAVAAKPASPATTPAPAAPVKR